MCFWVTVHITCLVLVLRDGGVVEPRLVLAEELDEPGGLGVVVGGVDVVDAEQVVLADLGHPRPRLALALLHAAHDAVDHLLEGGGGDGQAEEIGLLEVLKQRAQHRRLADPASALWKR